MGWATGSRNSEVVAEAAFGESCRRRRHLGSSLHDPLRPWTIQLFCLAASRCPLAPHSSGRCKDGPGGAIQPPTLRPWAAVETRLALSHLIVCDRLLVEALSLEHQGSCDS